MWNIMPQQPVYMEIDMSKFTLSLGSLGGQKAANALSMPDTKVDRQKIGSEQIGQYTCDKYRVTVTSKNETHAGTRWAARPWNDFPVNGLDDKTGTTVEFRDINMGPQDASLFPPPSGFRKVAMPGFGHH
jgi:hypothetical protein